MNILHQIHLSLLRSGQISIVILLSFISIAVHAQTDGYWDKERSTYKEIVVKAGDRAIISTEDFPAGTTELVYRITLLDENQQLAGSLVSLLKAIPDPSGISQGSAGAVFILSKVSGDDKCTYAAFSEKKLALDYFNTGKPDKACLYQNNPVSKEVKVLSRQKSTCFSSDNLWFGFESSNWLLRQKIILEVVPWVDLKARTGWNAEAKQSVNELCRTSALAGLMSHPDDLCLCILDRIKKDHDFPEYTKLTAAEKTKLFRDSGNRCLSKSEADATVLSTIRQDAHQYLTEGKYDAAAKLLLTGIVNNGNATAFDFSSLGEAYIYLRQYSKAIATLRQGEKLDDAELLIQLNLAHAYLLNGDYSKARDIHKRFRTQNVTAAETWTSKTTSDFDRFRKAGLVSDDFDRILKLFR